MKILDSMRVAARVVRATVRIDRPIPGEASARISRGRGARRGREKAVRITV